MKDKILLSNIVKVDDLCKEEYNKWENLLNNINTLLEEYNIRARLFGRLW